MDEKKGEAQQKPRRVRLKNIMEKSSPILPKESSFLYIRYRATPSSFLELYYSTNYINYITYINSSKTPTTKPHLYQDILQTLENYICTESLIECFEFILEHMPPSTNEILSLIEQIDWVTSQLYALDLI